MFASDQLAPALYQKREYFVHTILKICSFHNEVLFGEGDLILTEPTPVKQGLSREDIVDGLRRGY
jgi:hypothetical protein